MLHVKMWQKKELLYWDVVSYYAYLPATFIYKDLSLKFIDNYTGEHEFVFWPSTSPNGNYAVSYTHLIFFWMSFHQNGLTLTLFARDYVFKEVNAFAALFFNLKSLLSIILAITGIVMIFTSKKLVNKIIAAAFFLGFGYLTYYYRCV